MPTAYCLSPVFSLTFERCPVCRKLATKPKDQPVEVMRWDEVTSRYPTVGCNSNLPAGVDATHVQIHHFLCMRCKVGTIFCVPIPKEMRELYGTAKTDHNVGQKDGST